MERKNTHSSDRDGLSSRTEFKSVAATSSDFVLQWGNRKRLRCMKFQVKNHSGNNDPNGSVTVQRSTPLIDRRVRSDLNNNNIEDQIPNQKNKNNAVKSNHGGNGYLTLRHLPASPSHRILRNTENSVGMRGHSNGVRGLVFPNRGDRQGSATSNKNNQRHHINGNHNSNHHNVRHHSGGAGSGSSDTAHGVKKGGSLSGGDAIAAVWAPNLVIALTNKEKEEDFWAIKGSKLPQRPKKRAKFIQRTLNLVSPGAWLCDLTLDRYEVREKEATKKRPRGLKAMGNMVSDSE